MLSCLLGQMSPGQLSPVTVVTWAVAYVYNFGHSEQLLLKTLSHLKSRYMRKAHGNKTKKTEKNSGPLTSLPLDHLIGD